ncbi:uncharacterized protein LOC126898221 [Daktulosphaira vitifoliae]|uniref:uncharacterized protein LOC126898221 n=1 Tax=Daktulosphaira vitifoliae TaxID=58002 RepID=UPI0021AA6E4B|nr:uncharacterized protein LOC126898221 [Daktulosphaira vitifoliae]
MYFVTTATFYNDVYLNNEVSQTLTTTVQRKYSIKSFELIDQQRNHDKLSEDSELQKKKMLTKQITEQIFKAKADVQLSNQEAEKTQQRVNDAITALSESRSHVFAASMQLIKAQEEVANAAKLAKTLQIKLATDHQKIYDAYKKVDSLTSLLIPLENDISVAEQTYRLRKSVQHFFSTDRSTKNINGDTSYINQLLFSPLLSTSKKNTIIIKKTRS